MHSVLHIVNRRKKLFLLFLAPSHFFGTLQCNLIWNSEQLNARIKQQQQQRRRRRPHFLSISSLTRKKAKLCLSMATTSSLSFLSVCCEEEKFIQQINNEITVVVVERDGNCNCNCNCCWLQLTVNVAMFSARFYLANWKHPLTPGTVVTSFFFVADILFLIQ